MDENKKPEFDTSWNWNGFHPFKLSDFIYPRIQAPTNWNDIRGISPQEKIRLAYIAKWYTKLPEDLE